MDGVSPHGPAADELSMGWVFEKARLALEVDDDALAAHRSRIRLRFSWLAALALLPFALLHLFNTHWVLFGMNLALSSVMAANALALQRRGAPLVPFWMLCCLLIAGVCVSVRLQGSYGVFWAYPGLFMLFFVLPRRQATALGLVLLVTTTATATLSLGVPLAARVLMSLGFTLVMIHVVLNVVSELQRALVTQTITDPLTGAFNRRHLHTHLVQQVEPAARQALTTSPLSPAQVTTRAKAEAALQAHALLIDIDHFKQINDEHGHDIGDAVLCRLVRTIQARKRSGDLLFRTGGEEFVLLLPQASREAALHVAEDLRQRLAQADLLAGRAVTVSIGLSTLAAGQTAEAWMKAADTALYEAKRQGRNRVVEAVA